MPASNEGLGSAFQKDGYNNNDSRRIWTGLRKGIRSHDSVSNLARSSQGNGAGRRSSSLGQGLGAAQPAPEREHGDHVGERDRDECSSQRSTKRTDLSIF